MGTGDNARDARERRLIKAAETYIERLGEAVMYLAQAVDDPPGGERFLTEIRFKVRYGSEGDVLVVLKAEQGDAKVIAFHSEARLDEALSGVTSRLRNGSLKWREDTPYEGS